MAFIQAADTVGTFAEGLTVTMSQVTGLNARLTALETRTTTLETQAASVPLGLVATGTPSTKIVLPDREYAWPGLEIETIDGKVDRTTLPDVAAALLPAIHDATVTSLTSGGLPSLADANGNIYQNNTGGVLTTSGGFGIRSARIKVGDYFGGDGRLIYPVSLVDGTSSGFPTAMEQQLFSFEVNDDMLRASTQLSLAFQLRLQMLNFTSRVRCEVVIEHGAITSQSTPGTPATNFEGITWNATALLRQGILIDGNEMTHPLGLEIIRAGNGALSANKIKYGFSSGAGSTPAAASFALRGRLINFDTANAVADARGTIFAAFEAATCTIQ